MIYARAHTHFNRFKINIKEESGELSMKVKEKILRFTLPFRPKKILRVLKTVKDIGASRSEVLKSLKDEWYTRMAETYLSYCKHWDMITITSSSCELTPFGEVIFQLHEAGIGKSVDELIYYAFASSKEFVTLGIIVQSLFDRLERYGPFEFMNADIPSRFVPEFEGRHDISDLTRVFWKANMLGRDRKGGSIVYLVEYRSPMLTSFVLSLLHYVNSRNLRQPYSITGFDKFRAFWFVSMDQFVKYLRRCRAQGWISYQEYADINQFHFNIPDMMELAKHIIQGTVE